MLKILIFFLGPTLCVCEHVMRATCVMQPIQGAATTVTGVVSFSQEECEDVTVTVKLEGLEPLTSDTSNLRHGFHVHELGDLTGGCGSTGGHYNPMNRNHGAPEELERHAGDFGNLKQTADGRIEVKFRDPMVSLHAGDFGNLKQTADGRIEVKFRDPMVSLYGPYSIIGRAIVLHEKADDLGRGGNPASLANGNAGARIGCCVIGIARGN